MLFPIAADLEGNHRGWLIAHLPPRWRAYAELARLDRPIGIWLLLFPCWWGLALAGGGWGDVRFYLWFALGAVIMRGAGCTLNDMIDRRIDQHVERTSFRPIASGRVTMRQAAVFLLVQLLLGFIVLIQFDWRIIKLGIASLILVAIYPFMKRVTWWPQMFLGLAFNWGALLGWTASRSDFSLAPLLLYFSGIAWTLGYDTIYAHQDRRDDARIGVKSTALRFGTTTRLWLAAFYGATIVFIGIAGRVAGHNLWLILALLVAAMMFFWQIITLDINLPENCLARFKANFWIGWIVLAGLWLSA